MNFAIFHYFHSDSKAVNATSGSVHVTGSAAADAASLHLILSREGLCVVVEERVRTTEVSHGELFLNDLRFMLSLRERNIVMNSIPVKLMNKVLI